MAWRMSLWLAGSGLRWVPVEHDGNTNQSPEEADRGRGDLERADWAVVDRRRWKRTDRREGHRHRVAVQRASPADPDAG